MKELLLFGPLLWLRKVVLYLLGSVVLLGILVYFLANSPWVIKKAADAFAPDYNISYSRIHGNVLTGVEIEDLRFENKPLAKHITLKWNPNGLIQKKIIVNTIVLNHVNVETIKALVDSFSSEDNESSEPFAFSVNVQKLSVDVDPFVEAGVLISNVLLEADKVYYASDVVSVKKMGLLIDTNITKVLLKASLSEGKINVETLRIEDLDTLAVQNLLAKDSHETTEESSSKDQKNPLIPHLLFIQDIELSIIARTFEPVEIEQFKLGAKNTTLNLDTLVVKEAQVSLTATSNLSNLLYKGEIDNNQLIGTVNVLPKEALFTLYNLPLRQEALDDIEIDLDVSKERVIANVDTQILQFLKAEKDAFNLDVDSFKSQVTYTMEEGTLKADSTAIVTTPYSKGILVTNTFTLDENISYSGNILVKQLEGIDAKFTKPINDLKINYIGDDSSINAEIRSSMLEGYFNSSDFKTADFHLESSKALLLRDYVELPIELNATALNVVIDAPIHFDANSAYVAKAKIRSNVVNIDANVSYDDALKVTSKIKIPKDSLLRPYSEALKWDSLSPLSAKAIIKSEGIKVDLTSKQLTSNLYYELKSTKVEGKVHLSGLDATLSGVVDKQMKLSAKIGSIAALLESVKEIYTIDTLPKVQGSVALEVTVDGLKKAHIQLKSPKIIYQVDHLTVQEADDIDIAIKLEEDTLVLEHYRVTYEKEKIFSTKPSTLTYADNLVSLLPLWINDKLKTEGSYDLKTRQGNIVAKAESLHIAHELIDLDTNIDVVTALDGNKTSVRGKVTLLGGNIHYDLSQKTFASDSDIMIVQDMSENEDSPFMENLSMELQIKTKKPLVYNKEPINIKLSVDLGIHKVENSELLVLGTVEVLEGGSYIFQNKKFVLEQSFVHFTGNPNKPLLELNVNYKALDYLVTIKITGSADLPQIDFSAKPSLKKEEILSLILFDTVEGAGTNNGDDMMKMMGGAMAKSALNDLGVKLDHLVLGEGNSVEVGKKLTDKMTIIYVNDTVSSVKLKYEHGKSTESVIGMSEESQSYDIIYKKDF